MLNGCRENRARWSELAEGQLNAAQTTDGKENNKKEGQDDV